MIVEVTRGTNRHYTSACPICGVAVTMIPLEFLGHCILFHNGGALTDVEKAATISFLPTTVSHDFHGPRDERGTIQFMPDNYCCLCLSHFLTKEELVAHLSETHDII